MNSYNFVDIKIDRFVGSIDSLQFIFQEYRNNEGGNLSSINLRQALSESFAAQQRFQEGVMVRQSCFCLLVNYIESFCNLLLTFSLLTMSSLFPILNMLLTSSFLGRCG
jgi:hypothetical protein